MTLRIKTTATFANAGLPVFTPLINGFTERSIVSLHRLNDVATVANALDDVSGLNSIIGTANASPVNTALSGGGRHLKGNAWLPTYGTVDITQPWTFAFGGQVLSTAVNNAGIVATPDYPARGMIVYSQPSSPTGATPVVGTYRESIDGAQSATTFGLPSTAWTYNRGCTVFLQHLGAGAGLFEVWCAGALVLQQTLTISTTGVQGSIGSKTTPMRFCAGSPFSTFIGQDINVEAAALWSKALTTFEKSTNYTAFAALATARGRAWV